ncbi:GNAT family N-acetyltransferase [Candidatus Poribacteria bacterium]|nr:GNAT family N-acetyltransferase [Candidatus Poribacteria bacterium]
MNVPKENLSKAIIRKYRPEDREAVRRICYDTGLMGDPIDLYFGCYELFADYWMNYYTDCEPESAFVAELDGRVIGYLVGCLDTSRQEAIQKTAVLPRIRKKLFTLGYKIDRRFFKFMWRYVRTMWRNEFADEPTDGYPAHLHMNLAEGYRSGGVGSRLIAAFLDYLRANNVKGLHLGTTSHNKLAVPFYKKWGFRLVSRYPFTMYEGMVPEKIEILFFTREV